MVEQGGRVGLRHRRAADEAEPRCRDRDRETEGKRRGVAHLVRPARRRRHHQQLVGERAKRRHHASAPDREPRVGLAHDLRDHVRSLQMRRARAVDLRVDQHMGGDQVVLAHMPVEAADIVAALERVAVEALAGRRVGRDHHVLEVRRTAQHAAGLVHPDLDGVVPRDHLVLRPGLEVGHAHRVAGIGRFVGHDLVEGGLVLHLHQPRHRPGGAGEAGVAGDVLHPLSLDRDVAAVLEGIEELRCGADRHGQGLSENGLPNAASYSASSQ